MCNGLFDDLSLSNSSVITALIFTCHFHLPVFSLTECVMNTYLQLTEINIPSLDMKTLYSAN